MARKTENDQPLFIRAIEGPVTVAHKKVGAKWHCTALEFDLVGIGSKREQALANLKAIVNTYLGEIIKSKGKARLFNPAEAGEWESEDKQVFTVTVAMAGAGEKVPARLSFSQARRCRDRIRIVDLLPSYPAASL